MPNGTLYNTATWTFRRTGNSGLCFSSVAEGASVWVYEGVPRQSLGLLGHATVPLSAEPDCLIPTMAEQVHSPSWSQSLCAAQFKQRASITSALHKGLAGCFCLSFFKCLQQPGLSQTPGHSIQVSRMGSKVPTTLNHHHLLPAECTLAGS